MYAFCYMIQKLLEGLNGATKFSVITNQLMF